MENTKIKLSFSVFGDSFDPELLDEIVGIENTSYHRKGEIIPNRPNLCRKETHWEFSTGFVQSLHFDEVSEELVDVLEKKAELILNYVNHYRLEVKLFVVIKIVGDNKPSVYMDKRFLHLMNLFNAEIDMDLYLLGED
jgi:hypothetical protein